MQSGTNLFEQEMVRQGKAATVETEQNGGYQGLWSREIGEMLVEGYKLAVRR